MDNAFPKYFRFLLTGFLLLCQPIAAFSQSSSERVEAPELRKEILEMTQKDQEVQEVIMRKAQAGEKVDPSDWARQDSVFSSHIHRAKEILDEYKWPGFELVGADGSQGFFLIIQHADADPAFQRKALEYLKTAFENNQASGKNVAYLTDRVLVAEGHSQLYGTQLNYDDRACPIPGNIENQDEVDTRRAEVGLEPLDEYIASSTALMGRSELCAEK